MLKLFQKKKKYIYIYIYYKIRTKNVFVYNKKKDKEQVILKRILIANEDNSNIKSLSKY